MVGPERDHHALCICLRAPTIKLLKNVMSLDKTWRELQDTPKQQFYYLQPVTKLQLETVRWK